MDYYPNDDLYTLFNEILWKVLNKDYHKDSYLENITDWKYFMTHY